MQDKRLPFEGVFFVRMSRIIERTKTPCVGIIETALTRADYFDFFGISSRIRFAIESQKVPIGSS